MAVGIDKHKAYKTIDLGEKANYFRHHKVPLKVIFKFYKRKSMQASPDSPETSKMMALAGAWSVISSAETQAMKIALRILGSEKFEIEGRLFIEASEKGHQAVDALREEFRRANEGTTADRTAFVARYVEEMSGNCDSVYDATLALTNTLVDFIPSNNPLHGDAAALLQDLKGIRSDSASARAKGIQRINARKAKFG